MSEKITNIAKNTSYFTLALIIQKIISFTYFTIIARSLGPEDLGKYYFTVSFTTIFAIFIDIGLANVITREVAKTPEKAEKLLGSALTFKVLLAVISFSAMAFTINILGYPELIKQLVYISSISMILDSFTLTFYAISRGFHNLSLESIGSIIFQLIILSTGLFVLRENLGLIWLIATLALASIFNFFYSIIILVKKWKVKIILKYDKVFIKSLIAITIPFSIYAIFQRLYTYLDTVFLSILAGDKYVGIYQVPFKIIFALQFLPMAFTASLYPALSLYWQNNKDQLAITFERAMNYLIIISLPIILGIIILADKIILLFKSGYTEAILPLQITIISLIFIFLNFAVGSLLNACDKQKINTMNMAAVLAASIISNIILIANFKAIGASITVLITNLLMFILGMRIVPKIIKFDSKSIIKTAVKAGASALIMIILVFYLKVLLNIFIVSIIGGAVYFICLYALGGFRKEDVLSVYESFIKKRIV
jgi:O-antigen/teichoic acid export membrane protein